MELRAGNDRAHRWWRGPENRRNLLSGEGGSGAFADDPVILAAMSFAPGEIVVVVDFFDDRGAKQRGYLGANPIAASVGVPATEIYAGDVLAAEVGAGIVGTEYKV